jgi:hypothetical protein
MARAGSTALLLVLIIASSAAALGQDADQTQIPVTLQRQVLATTAGSGGRQQWLVNSTIARWVPSKTAIVVVDMWDTHWCKSDVTRIQEIAIPMNATLAAARQLGIHVIFAPSDVTSYYAATAVRRRTLTLRNATLPASHPKYNDTPPFPLGTATDYSCDDGRSKPGSPWTHQLDVLFIDERVDYLIAADLPGNPSAGTQELFNIVYRHGIQNIAYVGVHENMCVMERPFAIEKVVSWGWTPDQIAVIRELVDVSYNPSDPPYVSHAEGLRLHTACELPRPPNAILNVASANAR